MSDETIKLITLGYLYNIIRAHGVLDDGSATVKGRASLVSKLDEGIKPIVQSNNLYNYPTLLLTKMTRVSRSSTGLLEEIINLREQLDTELKQLPTVIHRSILDSLNKNGLDLIEYMKEKYGLKISTSKYATPHDIVSNYITLLPEKRKHTALKDSLTSLEHRLSNTTYSLSTHDLMHISVTQVILEELGLINIYDEREQIGNLLSI